LLFPEFMGILFSSHKACRQAAFHPFFAPLRLCANYSFFLAKTQRPARRGGRKEIVIFLSALAKSYRSDL
jgi:hypothetical protein